MTETRINRPKRLRWIAVGLAALVALAAGVGSALGVVGGSSASAAATGFYYAAGIFPTANQNLSIGSLTRVTVQNDEAEVANTMTPEQLTAATTALGGTPTVGFEVTKNFDSTDKATSIAALAQTKLYSAGLWTYYNGTLCDHLRSAPVYVAFVDQTPPPAGSTAAITETIQFVATKLTQVLSPSSCPASTAKTTTGAGISGTITVNGVSYTWPLVQNTVVLADEHKIRATLTKTEVDKYTLLFGKTPDHSITLAKGIDASDNKLFWDGLISAKLSELVVTISQSGTPQVRWTIHDPIIKSIEFNGTQGKSPTKKITLLFTKFTSTPLI
jgi:hypothetical protein